MGESNKPARGRNRAVADDGIPRPPGALRERWLEEKVRQLYQDVVDERVPNELLQILDRLPNEEK